MEQNIFVIIPVHNNKDRLIELVTALTKDPISKKIVIVDNGSTDGTIAHVRQQFSQLFVIENKANLGRVKALNIGIEFAKNNRATHVLLVSPSITLPQTPFMAQLLAKKNDIVMPIIVRVGLGKPAYGLGGTMKGWFRLPRYRWQSQPPPKSLNSMPSYGVTDCLLISDRVMKRCGELPDTYTSYYADVAFCLAAKQAGLKIGIVPTVTVSFSSQHQTDIARKQQIAQLRQDYQLFSQQTTFPQGRPSLAVLVQIVLQYFPALGQPFF